MQQHKVIPKQVRSAVQDALEILQRAQWKQGEDYQSSLDTLPSLLEQCGALARADEATEAEPIRTIHHFACTGGTLIAKCLACVPNIQVLSEVDPLSTLTPSGGAYTPGDVTRLAEASNRALSGKEKVDLFMSSLSTLYELNQAKGLRLLIRDHAHSHFCVGGSVPDRSTVAGMLREKFRVRGIVTVRHPLDSYLSLHHNDWVHFQPSTIEEYAIRYEAFLDTYLDEPLFRYEDFLQKPEEVLREMCVALDFPYPEGFRQLFSVHSFSGDSGRSGSDLAPRKRRKIPDSVAQELSGSRRLHRLAHRMGYDYDL